MRKLFAANLRVDGKPSTWDFGYIDESKFKGDIIYTPVVGNKKHWTVGVGSYAVGEGSFSGSDGRVGEVIVDSGTSLVYLPEHVVSEYYRHIEGSELQLGHTYTFPCNGTVPDFHFKIEDATLSIPGNYINYTVYDPTSGLCAGGITTQLNMRYSVLGNLFMKNYYVIHSLEDETPKVGFALH
jgi:aspergillopepsin I